MVPAGASTFGRTRDPVNDPSGWRARLLSVALVVGVAGLVVGLGWLGFSCLWAWVTDLEEFRVCPADVALGPPPWLKEAAFKADLIARDPGRLLQKKLSLFKTGLTRDVARAYESSPWVLKVKAVRKHFPNRLAIDLEWRKPFALVRHDHAEFIIDAQGVVLPHDLYAPPGPPAGNVPIELKYKTQAPPPGRPWSDPGLTQARRLLSFLLRMTAHPNGKEDTRFSLFDCLELEAIEVWRTGRMPWSKKVPLILRTTSGANVLWGRAPADHQPASPAEVPAEQKLKALILATRPAGKGQGWYGPDLAGVKYLDLRWDKVRAAMR